MTTVKKEIARLLEQAIAEAQKRELLPPMAPPEVLVERPQNAAHGDYATSLPLKLARSVGMNPLTIAKNLAGLINAPDQVQDVAVAPPGFINFRLNPKWLTQQVEAILKAGETFGNNGLGNGQKVQLEFVSVNPTGPLHVGHGRGAILGSTLANVLRAAGYSVTTEYYVNDAGTQIDTFRASLYTRYRQVLGQPAEMPSEGYMGAYMIDLAKELAAEVGDKFLKVPEAQAIQELGDIGLARMLAAIKADLDLVGVSFDVWFREKDLFTGGQYDKVMSLLKQGSFTTEKAGALWFTSSALGEDKDNVLVRSSGASTYFASDIAYHYNKFVERGFDRVINIWGADHQGHVPRMKAVISALGLDPGKLEVIIAQMVTLRRGDEVLRVSKRTGDIITLREVVQEVGPDACRFFFLSRSADSQMDFDLELAKKQSDENPVYYVQYAHARIASILRLAQEKGIDYSQGDVSLLTSEPEQALIRKMLLLSETIELAARNLEPHHLPYYAQDLATVFHSFYKQCRVVTNDQDMTRARLKLVEAAKVVLARTLHLMGMTAPEKM